MFGILIAAIVAAFSGSLLGTYRPDLTTQVLRHVPYAPNPRINLHMLPETSTSTPHLTTILYIPTKTIKGSEGSASLATDPSTSAKAGTIAGSSSLVPGLLTLAGAALFWVKIYRSIRSHQSQTLHSQSSKKSRRTFAAWQLKKLSKRQQQAARLNVRQRAALRTVLNENKRMQYTYESKLNDSTRLIQVHEYACNDQVQAVNDDWTDKYDRQLAEMCRLIQEHEQACDLQVQGMYEDINETTMACEAHDRALWQWANERYKENATAIQLRQSYEHELHECKEKLETAAKGGDLSAAGLPTRSVVNTPTLPPTLTATMQALRPTRANHDTLRRRAAREKGARLTLEAQLRIMSTPPFVPDILSKGDNQKIIVSGMAAGMTASRQAS